MLTSTFNQQLIAAQLESQEIVAKGISFIKQHKKMLLALAIAFIAMIAFFAPELVMAQTANPFADGAKKFRTTFKDFAKIAIVIILMVCGFAVMRGSLGLNTFLYIAVGGIFVLNAQSIVDWISGIAGEENMN
jgi:type IV secretory pathway VirB2 component (pilin)